MENGWTKLTKRRACQRTYCPVTLPIEEDPHRCEACEIIWRRNLSEGLPTVAQDADISRPKLERVNKE